METFFSDLRVFVKHLISELEEGQLIQDIKQIDHVCYRVANMERYNYWRQQLDTVGLLLSEALVNGRPIATYKLHKRIQIDETWSVDLVELPSPKQGSPYSEGFEHIEGVTKDSLKSFIKIHSALKFNTYNLNAPINSDVSLKLKSGLVKFHERSLEDIIAEENAGS